MIEATSCGGVVIFRGKILLLYKNFKNKYEGWVLPKGTVEAGEEYKDTALREVLEESGARASIIKYIGKSEYTFSVPEDTCLLYTSVSENTQKGSGIPHGPLSVHASVKTISQAYSCLKEGADRLYLPHTFLRGDWEAALKDMKNEFPGAELYLSLPVILRKQDEARLERLSAALGTGLFDGVQAASLSGRQWLYEKDWKGGVCLLYTSRCV